MEAADWTFFIRRAAGRSSSGSNSLTVSLIPAELYTCIAVQIARYVCQIGYQNSWFFGFCNVASDPCIILSPRGSSLLKNVKRS